MDVSTKLLTALDHVNDCLSLHGKYCWNISERCLYYINNTNLYSIQVLLMNLQRSLDALTKNAASGGNISTANLPSTSVRMAITVMGVLPVMIIYPFLQKYFVKGISIGAVKG